MDKKSKEEIYKLFSDAFHEVVPPLLEDATEKLAKSEEVFRLEEKIEKINDRLDRHGKQLENHEERIQVFETASL